MRMERTEMTTWLGQVVGALYGDRPVPPEEGGTLFRSLCEERRRAGDLYWTEGRLCALARDLGFWPWSVSQITAAFRSSRRPARSSLFGDAR